MQNHVFPIIKDAPLPPKGSTRKSPRARISKYPFAQMKVGDAFDVPRVLIKGKDNEMRDPTHSRVISAALQWKKNHNKRAKFTTRAIDAKTVRCWRIK